MRTIGALIALGIMAGFDSYGQGQFVLGNPTAPTRIWRIDGPLAGPGIWAHMLAGPTANSLTPVGPDVEHIGSGAVSPGSVTIQGTLSWPDPDHAYIQMVAWNGVIWGTSLEGVPPGQLGKTDVVLTPLGYPPGHSEVPKFTQPAIVPSGPPLSITATSTNTLLFLWPNESTTYALQQSPNLSATKWTSLTNAPQLVGSTNQLTIPIRATAAFYRLASE
jgi:hypothetical protein